MLYENDTDENNVERLGLETFGFYLASAKDLINKKISDFPYVIDKLIPKNAITAITADSGKGKSLIALEMANCISRGVAFLGEFKVEKMKVLYIDGEMNEDLVAERAKSILGNESDIDFISEQFFRLDDEEHREAVALIIKTYKYGLVIFDTLVTVHSGDENSSKDMRNINQLMLKLIRDTGVSIIYLHHHRKQMKGEIYSQSSSRGSTEIIAKVASHLLIDSKRSVNEDGMTVVEAVISQEKARRPESTNKIGLNILYNQLEKKTYFEYTGEVDDRRESTRTAERFVIDILNNDPSKFSIRALVDKAKAVDRSIREHAIRMACKDLVERKLIREELGGKAWNSKFYYMPIRA